MKVYLLWGESGDYDDWQRSLSGVFVSFDSAANHLLALVQKAGQKPGEWKKSGNFGEENVWYYIGTSKYGAFDSTWWQIEEAEVFDGPTA